MPSQPLQQLKRRLQSPVFADPDDQRIADLLNMILWLFTAVSAIYLLLSLLNFWQVDFGVMMVLVVFITCCNGLLLLHRGVRPQHIATPTVWMIWLLSVMTAIVGGGINTLILDTQIISILIAAIVLNVHQIVLLTSGSILAGLATALLHSFGALPTPLIARDPLSIWFIYAAALGLSGWLLSFTVRQFNHMLIEMRTSKARLDEQNALLEAELVERRRVTQALRESELRLNLAMDIAKIGTWDWDMHTGSNIWNDHTFRLFGMESNEFDQTALGYASLIHPDDAVKVQAAVEASISLGKPIDLEYRITHKDGTIHWMISKGQPRFDDAGKPLSMFGIVQDITERKQAEEIRLQLHFERERVTVLKEFVGTLSHDLKTPLSAIYTGLDLLKRTDDPARRLARIEQLESHAQWLERLIQDTLTMSRLDQTPQLSVTSIELLPLVQQVVQRFSGQAEQKQIQITVEANVYSVVVAADKDELMRAVTNLVENALNYTEQNGTVHIGLDVDGGNAVLEIQDTGVGIAAEDIPHIFDRFYRAKQSRGMVVGGSGLGLAIVKRIVEMHRGIIDVSSQPSIGTTFRLRLPVIT